MPFSSKALQETTTNIVGDTTSTAVDGDGVGEYDWGHCVDARSSRALCGHNIEQRISYQQNEYDVSGYPRRR